MHQLSLSATFDEHSKRTRKEVFLAKMDKLVPWQALSAVIEPLYPKVGKRVVAHHVV